MTVQPCTPTHDSWANFKLWFSIMIYNSNFQFLFFVFNLIMQVPSSLLKTREHSQAHCQVSSGWVIQVSLAHYFSLTSQQFTNEKQLFCLESALLADIFSTASELCLQTFSIENSILVYKTGRRNLVEYSSFFTQIILLRSQPHHLFQQTNNILCLLFPPLVFVLFFLFFIFGC